MTVHTAPLGTPLPRTDNELLRFRAASFQELWQQALEPFVAALKEAMSTISVATKAMSDVAPKPKHTPPFWAINPTKQKRA